LPAVGACLLHDLPCGRFPSSFQQLFCPFLWDGCETYSHSECDSLLPPGERASAFASDLLQIKGKTKVCVRRLDDLLSQMGCSQSVDYLKIDVQGAEVAVLRGAEETLCRIRFVMIEMNFSRAY